MSDFDDLLADLLLPPSTYRKSDAIKESDINEAEGIIEECGELLDDRPEVDAKTDEQKEKLDKMIEHLLEDEDVHTCPQDEIEDVHKMSTDVQSCPVDLSDVHTCPQECPQDEIEDVHTCPQDLGWRQIYNSKPNEFVNYVNKSFYRNIKKEGQPLEKRYYVIGLPENLTVKEIDSGFANKTFTWREFIKLNFHKYINYENPNKKIYFIRDDKQYYLKQYIAKSQSDIEFEQKMKLVKQAHDYFHKLEDLAKSKGCKYMSSDKMLCDSDKEYFYLDAEKIKSKVPEDVYNMMVNMKLLHITCKARGSTK